MTTGKRLQGNGLWESSRLTLPEHKEAINRHLKETERVKKPILDEQQQERIQERLAGAFRSRSEVSVIRFTPYGNETVTGTIAKLDALSGRILVSGTWVSLRDIVEVV
jgi:hypothetical protein